MKFNNTVKKSIDHQYTHTIFDSLQEKIFNKLSSITMKQLTAVCALKHTPSC